LGKPGNNPYCIHRALQLESEGLRERVVKVEQAPGIPFDNGRFEIVKEPIPDNEPTLVAVSEDGEPLEEQQANPEILGISLERVTQLRTSDVSVWETQALLERLKKQ
jgi:hypothetical protein